jgi:hypothetical protein
MSGLHENIRKPPSLPPVFLRHAMIVESSMVRVCESRDHQDAESLDSSRRSLWAYFKLIITGECWPRLGASNSLTREFVRTLGWRS